ncbi:hypothetical protein BV20DRAFT_757845 [Pilatotrama ljubarskyi]|nr:hypothetical protein BV20DRAFT_757845 [Pilatotrama ljubarskyi]
MASPLICVVRAAFCHADDINTAANSLSYHRRRRTHTNTHPGVGGGSEQRKHTPSDHRTDRPMVDNLEQADIAHGGTSSPELCRCYEPVGTSPSPLETQSEATASGAAAVLFRSHSHSAVRMPTAGAAVGSRSWVTVQTLSMTALRWRAHSRARGRPAAIGGVAQQLESSLAGYKRQPFLNSVGNTNAD